MCLTCICQTFLVLDSLITCPSHSAMTACLLPLTQPLLRSNSLLGLWISNTDLSIQSPHPRHLVYRAVILQSTIHLP